MKFIINLFHYLLFGNIFIGAGAVALSYSTYLQLNSKDTADLFLFSFIFSATVFVYTFHALRVKPEASRSLRLDWITSNKIVLNVNLIVSGIAVVVLSFWLNPEKILIIVPLGVISYLYTSELRIGKIRFSLRELAYSKALIVGFSWAVVTFLLPVTEVGFALSSAENLYFPSRVLLITALCIPFDIRDALNDGRDNMKTLPASLGISKAKLIALLILGVFMILSALSDGPGVALSTTLLSALFVIFSDKMKDYFFSLYGDGLLIVYSLLIYLFNR